MQLTASREDMLFHLLAEHHADTRRHAAVELYEHLRREQSLPLVYGDHAIFLYHGPAQHVSLVGDWTYWQPATHLQRIEHTDLFYIILQFPVDARLQYKFIVDGAWVNDPGNDRVQAEGFGLNTEFMMPLYADNSHSVEHPNAPGGTIIRTMFQGHSLEHEREGFLYLPAAVIDRITQRDTIDVGSTIDTGSTIATGADAQLNEVSLVLVHDGAEALHLGKFATILDNLHAAGSIQSTAAVFLSPGNRNEEYASSDAYIDFCAHEVLPQARKIFAEHGVRISEQPHRIAVCGASLGGLLATKTGLRHSSCFGTVLAQSPSYWWNKGEIFRSEYLMNAEHIRFVVQTGTICDAKDLASLMVQRLRALGADVSYFEYAQGHTWGNWRSTFADALRAWNGLNEFDYAAR
jgi:enterochelin esterase-like enzyme